MKPNVLAMLQAALELHLAERLADSDSHYGGDGSAG